MNKSKVYALVPYGTHQMGMEPIPGNIKMAQQPTKYQPRVSRTSFYEDPYPEMLKVLNSNLPAGSKRILYESLLGRHLAASGNLNIQRPPSPPPQLVSYNSQNSLLKGNYETPLPVKSRSNVNNWSSTQALDMDIDEDENIEIDTNQPHSSQMPDPIKPLTVDDIIRKKQLNPKYDLEDYEEAQIAASNATSGMDDLIENMKSKMKFFQTGCSIKDPKTNRFTKFDITKDVLFQKSMSPNAKKFAGTAALARAIVNSNQSESAKNIIQNPSLLKEIRKAEQEMLVFSAPVYGQPRRRASVGSRSIPTLATFKDPRQHGTGLIRRKYLHRAPISLLKWRKFINY